MSTCGMDSKRYRIITSEPFVDRFRIALVRFVRIALRCENLCNGLGQKNYSPRKVDFKTTLLGWNPSHGKCLSAVLTKKSLKWFLPRAWAWAKDFGPISPELSLETSCKCTVDYSTSHLFSCLLFVMTSSGQCSCRYVFFSTPIVETKSFIDGGHLQKKCFSSRRLGRLLHHGDKVWKTLQSLG